MQSQRMCRHSRPKPPSNLKILHPTRPAPRQTHRGVPLLHDDDLPKPWRTWKAKSTGNMERNLALNRASPAGKTFLPWAHHDRRGPSGRGKSSALPAAIYPATPCPSWQGRRECEASCPFLPRQNCDRTSRQAAMSTSRKHLILETYFFPLRTKALKGKKKKERRRKRGRERERGDHLPGRLQGASLALCGTCYRAGSRQETSSYKGDDAVKAFQTRTRLPFRADISNKGY